MRLISKKLNIYKEYTDFFSLFEVTGKIQQVLIASAYADVDTIRGIYSYFSKHGYDKRGCRFLVFIDRAASQAMPGQKYCRRYKILNTNIKNSLGESSGIKIIGGKLFHSKIVYIKTTTEERIVIGSMNITQNGTEKYENEELVLYSEKPTKNLINDTLSYFSQLEDSEYSSWIDDIEYFQKQITIRDFFINGNLYVQFSPTNLFLFTLNLPENVRGAAANLHPLLDAETKNSISMLLFCKEQKKLPVNYIKSERWKKYCIETLHGYWAPNFLCQKIDNILFSRKDSKESQIYTVFKEINTTEFEERIFSFFEEISKSIMHQGSIWDHNETFERWLRWRDRLLKRALNENGDAIDELIAQRLNSGVQKSNFFDIFVDSDHARDFIATVLEFFDFHLGKRTNNEIVKIVKGLNKPLCTEDDFLKIIQDKGETSFTAQLHSLC